METDTKAPTGTSPPASQASSPGGGSPASFGGILDQPIATGADFVEEIARSARGFADNLDGGAPQLAQMVRRAASSAESFAHDIRGKSTDELVDVTEEFARRQPALFVGAAVAAGFLLARFIKAGVSASAPQARATMAPATTADQAASGKPAPARQSAGAYHDA